MGCRTEQQDNYYTANSVEGCHFIYLLCNFSLLKHFSCFSKSLCEEQWRGDDKKRWHIYTHIYVYIKCTHTHALQNIYMGRTRSAIISNQDVIDLVLDFSLPLSFSQQHLALVTAGRPGSIVTHHYVSVSHTIRNLCVFVPWSLALRRKTRTALLCSSPHTLPWSRAPTFPGDSCVACTCCECRCNGEAGGHLVLCCRSINSASLAPFILIIVQK